MNQSGAKGVDGTVSGHEFQFIELRERFGRVLKIFSKHSFRNDTMGGSIIQKYLKGGIRNSGHCGLQNLVIVIVEGQGHMTIYVIWGVIVAVTWNQYGQAEYDRFMRIDFGECFPIWSV